MTKLKEFLELECEEEKEFNTVEESWFWSEIDRGFTEQELWEPYQKIDVPLIEKL